MPFQKISGNFVELSIDNYLGSIKSGSSISDLGFRTYKESVAGVMPVSGTGGSPGISLALNTTNPLSSDADLRLVKDSVNRQGEGFSVDFSIQNRHQSKVLQISFDMELISGTYTNQDLIPKSGTFTVASTTCTVTASHSLVVGQAVNMNFLGGTAPASGLYVITAIVPGVSFSFTISSGSGSGVSCTWNIVSSLRVYIIANPTTNPIVIEPVNTGLQLGIANQKVKHIASFQTNNSGNSYRMVIHVTKPGILPYTVDFANFRVWEQQQSLGAVITDWASYNAIDTPDLNALPTTREFEWRRIGSNVQIRGRGITNTNTFPAVLAKILIPNGLKFNAMPSMSGDAYNGRFVVGRVNQASTGSTTKNYNLMVVKDTGGNLNNSYLYITPNNDGGGSPSFDQQNWGNLFGYTSTLIFEAEFPIAGWGSNVAMSSDTGDGRVVVVSATNITSSSYTANTTNVIWVSKNKDSHNSYNETTGIFTVPVGGDYKISLTGMYANGTGTLVFPFVDGSRYRNLNFGSLNSGAPVYINSSLVLPDLRAGNQVSIRLNTTTTLETTAHASSISIERISAGSQIIATQENVSVICRTISNGLTTTPTGISWTSKEVDSHGSFTASTSRFTAPMSGVYQFDLCFRSSNGNSGYSQLYDVTNSVILRTSSVPSDGNSIMCGQLSSSVRLLAGQIIDVKLSQASGTSTLSSNLYDNYLSITRVGNY